MSLTEHWTISAAGGPVHIRPIRADEVAEFRALRLEALREHPEAYGGTLEEAVALPLDEWHKRLQTNLGGPRGILYVAEAQGELIGMAGISRPEAAKLRHTGMIWGVYLRRSGRGAAMSDRLIEACVSWAQAHELRIVRLSVVTTNVAAIRLYARCGFHVYGVEAEALMHNGQYYDELLMARRMLPTAEGVA